MRKGFLLISLVVMLVLGIGAMRAADDYQPKPGTPEDNECNPGGVLYREQNQDGCPTVWYWKAGWYLARYNQGIIARADFPTEFESVLPPAQEAPCWFSKRVNFSLRYLGPTNTMGNVLGYTNTDCSGTALLNAKGELFVVFADNLTDARAVCGTHGTVLSTVRLNDVWYLNAPVDAYICAYT